MFIRKKQHMKCTHCVRCRWCLHRDWRKDMFKVKDGPSEFWFCDCECAAKFVKYRHMIGTAHILKMGPVVRSAYLDGMTLDDYISNGMKRHADAKVSHNANDVCNVHNS